MTIPSTRGEVYVKLIPSGHLQSALETHHMRTPISLSNSKMCKCTFALFIVLGTSNCSKKLTLDYIPFILY